MTAWYCYLGDFQYQTVPKLFGQKSFFVVVKSDYVLWSIIFVKLECVLSLWQSPNWHTVQKLVVCVWLKNLLAALLKYNWHAINCRCLKCIIMSKFWHMYALVKHHHNQNSECILHIPKFSHNPQETPLSFLFDPQLLLSPRQPLIYFGSL